MTLRFSELSFDILGMYYTVTFVSRGMLCFFIYLCTQSKILTGKKVYRKYFVTMCFWEKKLTDQSVPLSYS